ncbi:hypothetical protein [Aquisphaera insulae]|uniref:hypothetical protein n=1 Tax=Aquisphaera insulae TaxID=2712864 RepID=UPI0013EA8FCA|nr:hypothetical protein [Aquisphaera insulae]
MNAEASRRNWIRNGAWAVLAALVPVAECPAAVDGNPPADQALAAPAAGAGSISAPKASGSNGRAAIPPPRAFRPDELGRLIPAAPPARTSAPIPPPRVFVADHPQPAPAPVPAPPPPAATALVLESGPAAPPEEPAAPAAALPEEPTAPAAPPANLSAALLSLGVAPKEEGQPEPAPAAATAEDRPSQPAHDEPSQPAEDAPARVAATLEPVAEPEPPAARVELEAQPAMVVESEPPASPVPPAAEPAKPAAEPAEPAPVATPPREEKPLAVSVPAAPPAGPAESASRAAAPALAPAAPPEGPKTSDDEVDRATCTTCGTRHISSDGHVFTGCANGNCIPGRPPCNLPANECNTVVGAFMQNLYQAICCPDPCYQPRWDPVANASLFADYARPRTVTRIRVDRGLDMTHPNRNLFFLMQTGPGFPKNVTARRNGQMYRWQGDPSLNWSELYLYQEAAGEKGSFFVEYPYRQINPLYSPTQAGFGDINFGTKSMLFDTELLQVAFQFRTYMPTGNASLGLGTGHISLDPSILAALKIGPETFYQAQVGQWIPIGGDPQIRGGVLYWLMSLNQVLLWTTPDSPLIGTLEMDGWSFQDGGYSDPAFIRQRQTGVGPHGYPKYGPVNPARGGKHPGFVASGGGVSYFNIGPGLRWSICNKVDLGGALTWSTTPGQWASPWFRFEVRFLF